MKRLFGYEFRKLYKSTCFYVCLILMGAFTVISVLSQAVMFTMLSADLDGYITGYYGLFNAVDGSRMSLMLTIFISIFICGEYTEGTMKNVIGHGISRTRFYFGRYLIVLVAVLVMNLVSMLCGWLTGAANGGMGEGYTVRFFLILLLQILSSFAYATLFYFFAVWVKKAGLSILMGIFIPALIELALGIFDMFEEIPFATMDYTIGGAFNTVNAGSIVTRADMTRVVLVLAVYIAILLLAGWLIAKRQEV